MTRNASSAITLQADFRSITAYLEPQTGRFQTRMAYGYGSARLVIRWVRKQCMLQAAQTG